MDFTTILGHSHNRFLKNKMTLLQQRRYAFWFGVVFIVLLFFAFILIYFLEIYKIDNMFGLFVFFFRVVLAGSLAGVAATIPGYFNIDWQDKLGIRAGGAFAVFVLIYSVNPPQIIATMTKEAQISDLFLGCDQLRGGVEPSDDTKNYCLKLSSIAPLDWRADLGMAKLNSVENKPDLAFEFSLRAWGAFTANNDGLSVLEAARDPKSPVHYDARTILHTLKVTSWGVGAFDFSNVIVDLQLEVGMIDEGEAKFEKIFNSAQSMSVVFRDNQVETLTESLVSKYDYEYFYQSCLLSWYYTLTNIAEVREAALDKYKKFKQALSIRDGTNAPTQRDQIACLEADAANLGANCGHSIGVPSFCPIFQLL